MIENDTPPLSQMLEEISRLNQEVARLRESKRERYAAAAMQGIISGSGNSDGDVEYTASIVAENAFKMADAMILHESSEC